MTRNLPAKYSFISLVVWLYYNQVSNYFSQNLEKGLRKRSRKYCPFENYFLRSWKKLHFDNHFTYYKFSKYSEEVNFASCYLNWIFQNKFIIQTSINQTFKNVLLTSIAILHNRMHWYHISIFGNKETTI